MAQKLRFTAALIDRRWFHFAPKAKVNHNNGVDNNGTTFLFYHNRITVSMSVFVFGHWNYATS
jgi:hypothetical protein